MVEERSNGWKMSYANIHAKENVVERCERKVQRVRLKHLIFKEQNKQRDHNDKTLS